jgi:hypothetical protein
MRIKRIVSIVLLSLFISLFQGVPVANAAGVPTWSNFTSNNPNRTPDGYGCQWQFSPAVNENGSPLTNYLVTIRTGGYTGTIFKEDIPISPAQTSTTLVQLGINFLSSVGISKDVIYYYSLRPVNAYSPGGSLYPAGGAPADRKDIGSCPVTRIDPPGPHERPTVVAGDTTATVTIVAPTTGNSPSSYTITAFDSSGTNAIDPTKTCTVTVPDTSCIVTGLTNGTSYTFKSVATNSGGSSQSNPSLPATPTGATAPTVTGVTSSTANGSYKVGDSISIQVTFNEAVTVSGTPQLTLETGSTDQVLNYASGSGTNTLTFTYTIQAGDTSSDLTYVATNSLTLNGGSIKNSSNLDAVLALPAPTATGSLGANKALVIDTTLPTVTSFSSTTPDGSYKAGDVIDITATLSEAVTAAASITVTLDNGQTVVLTHSSENNTLTGSYTIGSEQSSSDLGVTSYSLTSAPTDAAGNIMTSTTMPSGNISGTRAIVVDTTLPTLISFSSTTPDGAYKVGSIINITATLSEAVTAGASITVILDNGRTVLLTHNAVDNTLIGTYTVAEGDSSADLNVVSYALTSAPVDTAGNIMSDLDVPSGTNNIGGSKAIVVDTTAPSTPSTPDLATESDTAGTSDTDNITSDNTPTINVSGTFSGTAVVTATKPGSTSVTCTISSNTCTLGTLADGDWSLTVTDTDAAGNFTTSSALSLTIDATKPVATVATLSQTNGTDATVPVQSNELGTAYLVGSGTSYTDPALVITAAGSYLVTISAINTDTSIATSGLPAGTYKVYVIDAAGNLSLASTNTITIAAASAPLEVLSTAPSGTTAINSTLSSTSTFSGVPTPSLTYQWVACTDNTDPVNCVNITGATNSTFTPSTSALVGTYIRVLTTATNSEGSATSTSSSTSAVVATAPGSPLLGTVVNGDLQITIPFTPPISDGGSSITKYQYSLDGATWLERTDSATVTSPIIIKFTDVAGVTPLVAGTSYTIQIRAVNMVSDGVAASTSEITAATTPGAPTAVSATVTGQTTVTVSFTAPVSNGGSAITTYTVVSSPGGITVTGSSSPISVTGLTSSTTYAFTVTASNTAGISIASAASPSVTTSAPPAAPTTAPAPAPEPEPACNAACVAAQNAAAAKVIADKAAAEAEAKVIAEKIASDAAAKEVAAKVVVDKSAAETAAKAAIDKAAAAAIAKAAADSAALQAAAIAKAAVAAQQEAVVAAQKAEAVIKSTTTSAAAKAAATATAAKAAITAANTVQAAATAAKEAATAKYVAANASKQVDIAIGTVATKTAAASSAAQANAIAAAAKAAANEAAKSAAEQASVAKIASNNASKEAIITAERIATEQKQAAEAAEEAKIATDQALKALEEKIAATNEAQKSAEAVVKLLEEKSALAEASVKAKDITERAAIDKKIEEVSVKIVEAQRIAAEASARAEATIAIQERAQANATLATQQAQLQAAKVAVVKAELTLKTDAATKASAAASLAAKVAAAAKAAASKIPAKAVISTKPSAITGNNSAKATISGLKPGQKVKVTVNVKGK